VITTEVTLEHFTAAMIEQLTPYAVGDKNVAKYLAQSLQQVIRISRNPSLNQLLRQQIEVIES
jgi:hypothetical protein